MMNVTLHYSLKMKVIGCAALIALGTSVVSAEPITMWDATAAEVNAIVDTNGTKWIDGKYLPIEGRWTLGDMANYYCRLPDTLTTNVNFGVHGQRFHTTGMQFRFHTDSKLLKVRYTSRSHRYEGSGNLTGVAKSGWDLYAFDKNYGGWRFVDTSHGSKPIDGHPNAREKNAVIGLMTDFILYLPLYDGVESFAIGIDKDAKIAALEPRKSGVTKPVVFYGTSITHGASASRPGLAFVNQVGRDLDVPIFNLGFSGSGIMEYELSEVIARVDASCYVLDCLWNMGLEVDARHTSQRLNSKRRLYSGVKRNYEPFIRNLRAKRPEVPIIMAGQCDVFQRGPNDKERYMKQLYDKLIAEGWKNLYYLPNYGMHHKDFEGTVDKCHPNDWGMKTMAEAYGDAVKTALMKAK